MKVVILSIALLGLAFLLLGCKVLFVKGSVFPMGHHAHHRRPVADRNARNAKVN